MLLEKIQIRKRETSHSGGTPDNIASRGKRSENSHSKKSNNGEKSKMGIKTDLENAASAANPTSGTFKTLAMGGIGITLGMGASRLLGTALSSKLPSLPFISNQTLVAATATGISAIAMKRGIVKPIATVAGSLSAAVAAGSLVFDLMRVAKIQPNEMVSVLISGLTGATPVIVASSKPSGANAQEIDVNTKQG